MYTFFHICIMFPNLKIKEHKSGVRLHSFNSKPYSYLILGKLHNLSKPWLPQLQNGSSKGTTQI